MKCVPASGAKLQEISHGSARSLDSRRGRTFDRALEPHPAGCNALCLARSSFCDEHRSGGTQPTNISMINRRNNQEVPLLALS